MTDQDRIARAILVEMDGPGGVEGFVENLLGHPEKYCSDLAHAAMCEVARIEVERGGFATRVPPRTLDRRDREKPNPNAQGDNTP